MRAVLSTNCLSAGDALRVIDHQDIIKHDFVLVYGDVVSNAPLAAAFEAHKRRRSADRAAIMTLLVRGGIEQGHRRRLGESPLCVVTDPSTQRLLKLEEDTANNSSNNKSLRLDTALFSERDVVSIRTDLVETGIYICAPEVLMLFSDNFDYQNIRRDFITGVLCEEELGNKLFIHELKNEYAARVSNFRAYDAVSKDVLGRWTFPLVPDTNLASARAAAAAASSSSGSKPKTLSHFRLTRERLYLDASASIARTAQVSRDSCIGPASIIGDGCRISESVLGRKCIIGTRATITASYLMSNVAIEEGATVTGSFLCEGVVVRRGAIVENGCVLSLGVVIDSGHVVPAGSTVTLCRQRSHEGRFDSDDDVECPRRSASDEDEEEGGHDGLMTDDDVALAGPGSLVMRAADALAAGGIPEVSDLDFEKHLVGPLGAGYGWSSPVPDEAMLTGIAMPPPVSSSMTSIEDMHASQWAVGCWMGEEDHSILSSGQSARTSFDGASSSLAATASDAEHLHKVSDGSVMTSHLSKESESHFKNEVAETFLRCVKEGISHENVVIELNGLKIAEDKTFADCARFIFTTMLGLSLKAPDFVPPEYQSLYPSGEEGDPETYRGTTNPKLTGLLRKVAIQLKLWTDLLQKFLKSEDDQVELLLTFEEFCDGEGDFERSGEHGHVFVNLFEKILKLLYDMDIVSEEAILQWADEKELADEDEKFYLQKAELFLKWLKEAEEEQSEEEDSNSE